MESASFENSSFLPSLLDIQKLSRLEDIQIILKDIDNRQTLVATELQDALKQSEQVETTLDAIDALPRKLKNVIKEAHNLEKIIDNSCDLAKNVSKKVRDLDTLRGRVKETLKQVADIIDVKNCVDGVQKAMEVEDFEGAAAHIQRYLSILQSVSNASGENETLQAGFLEEATAQPLKQAQQHLKDIAKSKLDQAIKSDEKNEILRYCSLYSMLGMKDEGVTNYAHYLRNVCSRNADLIHKQLLKSLGHSTQVHQEDEEVLTCTVAITRLFEMVAQLIEDNTSTVEQKFGPGSSVTIIRHLQIQTDIHSTKILDLFMDHFRIIKMVEDFQRRGSSKDPREIAPLLDEVALMSQAVEVYDTFIRKRGRDSLELAKNAPQSRKQPTTEDGLLHVSELNRRMQEIIGQYIQLEEYFMVESIRKAIKMDDIQQQSDDTDNIMSHMVDRVFFIIQKSIQRALLTCNLNALCATVNIVVSVLVRDLKEVLQRQLQDQLAKLSGSSRTDTKITYTVVLNNFEVSSEHILKIRKEIETESSKVFSFHSKLSSSDSGSLDVKLKSCLDDLTEASNTYKKILQNYLEQVANAQTPKIKPLMEVFTTCTYDISETEFAEREINDPFVHQFIASIDSTLKPFKASFTPSNYDSFVHIIIRFVCLRIEHEILKKKFNQLGGLQLDKELRTMQNYFNTITQKTARDKFARLSQMATLLYLEKVSELSEYWGQNSGHMTWRLTPGEVRRVLSLRVDFNKEAIAKLKL